MLKSNLIVDSELLKSKANFTEPVRHQLAMIQLQTKENYHKCAKKKGFHSYQQENQSFTELQTASRTTDASHQRWCQHMPNPNRTSLTRAKENYVGIANIFASALPLSNHRRQWKLLNQYPQEQ